MDPLEEAMACFACGDQASWVVAMRYDAANPTGRLMAYCGRCRDENAQRAGLVMPMAMFRLDPPRLLDLMYLGDATGSDPDQVAEMFGVEPGPWVASARRVLADRTDAPRPQEQVGDWRGVLPSDRDATVARHRRAQGEWRSETLHWPAGPPPGVETAQRYPTLPNFLARKHEQWDAYETGVNLMSDAARAYAADRVALVQRLGGVVERDRLYRNLLSSQPLAFSVAGELRARPAAAAALLAELSGRPVRGFACLEGPDSVVPQEHRKPQTSGRGYQPLEAYTLDGIEAEWFPPRWAHTDDKSGFDMAACLRLETGARLLVSIEVKYTDSFSAKAVEWDRYRDHLSALGLTEESLDHLVEAGCSQVLRQVMITDSLRRHGLAPGVPPTGHVDEAISVVLAREGDEGAKRVVQKLREHLDVPVQFWSLSGLIDAAGRQEALAEWASDMRRRYLRVE